ncbi:2-dehydro-3-deoxygalactonokinase [Niveispirillum cyanobacteriorum]|uniref:2-dehydro-3-deoxygalactonokinase n=1 Tax=Niveispirillum cyanobacteriorum TaxID=1612173 RepID=A0A2K9NJX2_9PROT|nr:2-dehydro-3-deoxygalactonokinase [Niveispirillum cyanobacteriorum]AUN33384.1 2-dehydro-3-deoxygalactonokinase [Niveispirillum cyanobacteriorum]GGE49128.1 2-dehydro-3-deoxygalactonokinase [Niveispirillum cyanobacteriorum]
MRRGPFIAGDWGTSNLRLWLCADDGTVLDRAEGPGVAAATGRLETVFLYATGTWRAAHGPLPTLMCGMVGSTIGWVEAAYHPCPADVRSLATGLTRFTAAGTEIAIVPGLSTRTALDAPDVMRGEETQILGVLASRPELAEGHHLLCLPGTHAKWALLNDGRVENFQTGFTGELFALLRQHSVLGRGTDGLQPQVGPAFTLGVERALSGISLSHLLFQARSRQLLDGMNAQDALSFLSGLVIGGDVAGGLAMMAGLPDTPVILVASPALIQSYQAALSVAGRGGIGLDGGDLALAGLLSIRAATLAGNL